MIELLLSPSRTIRANAYIFHTKLPLSLHDINKQSNWIETYDEAVYTTINSEKIDKMDTTMSIFVYLSKYVALPITNKQIFTQLCLFCLFFLNLYLCRRPHHIFRMLL
jgi:hypothetical protein